MALTFDEIQERYKGPLKSGVIQKALNHETRLRFHSEAYMDMSEIQRPANAFLENIRKLIPADKFTIFLLLFKFPLNTLELTEEVYEALERVYVAQDGIEQCNFTMAALQEDWDAYKQRVKALENWQEESWGAVKASINSVLIVDLPTETKSSLAEPYFYFLDIANVVDYGYANKTIQWIMFKTKPNELLVFDDTTYRTFELNDKNQVLPTPLTEKAHELGYCPARFFWSDSLTREASDIKRSPLSSQLANLDWLLSFSTSKKHLDLYAPYPIYSTYEVGCDFISQDQETCDNGFLKSEVGDYAFLRDGSVRQCPVCSAKRLTGPGSFIEVPAPTDKEDPDLRDPVKITTIDVNSLKYNVDEVERLKRNIYAGVVGSGHEMQQSQSFNELQVKAGFEGRLTVLNNLKKNLETAKTFVISTLCKLRYGQKFSSCYVNMGTEFYIQSVDALRKQYKEAKDSGASEFELDDLSNRLISTEYMNNPNMTRRMQILRQLEPYRHNTKEELLKLSSGGFLNRDLFLIKINFTNFISRFERENLNVLDFGAYLSLDKKIEIITQKLLDYAREQNPQPKDVNQNGSDAPGTDSGADSGANQD